MELTHQHSLFEELIMAPKIDASFPNEFFPNTWNCTPFDQTPDLHLPLSDNPPLLELISPPEFNCPFGEFQSFLDAIASPEFGASFYDNDDYLPPMAAAAVNEDGGTSSFLETCTHARNMEDGINVGLYSERGSRSKKPDGQPSKNLMAERRRRKRLNDRLSMLRSIVPKISKMDRTSILSDTIDYVRELLEKVRQLRDEGMNEDINLFGQESRLHEAAQLRNPPKFNVERRSQETNVEVCCSAKPGLLMSTLSTLDNLGLDVQQCVVSCFNDFTFRASCNEAHEQRSMIISSEDVKQALFRNAGYGGRCL